jgi:hypothetical protein
MPTTQPLLDVFLRPIVSDTFGRGLFYALAIPGGGFVTLAPFFQPDVAGKMFPAIMPPVLTAAPAPTTEPCYIMYSLFPFNLPPGANGGLVYLTNPIATNTPDGSALATATGDFQNDNVMGVVMLVQVFVVRPFGT